MPDVITWLFESLRVKQVLLGIWRAGGIIFLLAGLVIHGGLFDYRFHYDRVYQETQITDS